VDYFIDERINLTEQTRNCQRHSAAIRHNLMTLGLTFADASQFALFAVYGFHGPTEKQTLNMTNKMRLSILDDFQPGRRKEPTAWNRQSPRSG